MAPHAWQPLEPSALQQALFQRLRFAIATPEQWARLPHTWPWRHLVPYAFRDNEGLMPWLLDLSALSNGDRDELRSAIAQGEAGQEPSPFAVLLKSDSPASRLAQHLSKVQCVVHQGQTAWLRLFDARVWAQLPRVMSPKALKRVFGPVTNWTTQLHGQWVETKPPATGLSWQDADVVDWDALLRVGFVNRVLALEGRLGWDDALRLGPDLDRLSVRAQLQYGLSRTEDIVAFAHYGLRHGPAFDSHPLIRKMVAEQQQDQDGDSTIVDILALVDDGQWALVQQHGATL